MAISGSERFGVDDLHALSEQVGRAWMSAADLDWSVPAGTVEWSCTTTADHAVDCVYAPFFADHGVHHRGAAGGVAVHRRGLHEDRLRGIEPALRIGAFHQPIAVDEVPNGLRLLDLPPIGVLWKELLPLVHGIDCRTRSRAQRRRYVCTGIGLRE